jgi:CubicO group peptidase (beta-lactamase class C family)
VDLPLASLDAYVADAMRAWRVPGVSIAVLREGESLARGYGRRSASRPSRVDPDTLFPLASCGKGFTAASCAMLVDDGRMRWDDPVVDHFPSFRLADADLTSRVTIRDLLAHRTGLPGGDLLWASAQFDRAETLRRLRYLKPVHRLRERFGYQNLMYVVAGDLAGRVSGLGYDGLIRRRLFDPLEMRSSLTNTAALDRRGNVAQPHAIARGRAVRVRAWEDPIGSGDGSLLSTARDLLPWLRFQLGEGALGSRRLLGRDAFRAMHEPQIPIRAGRWELEFFRTLGPRRASLAYGLGWFLMDYRGRKVVRHTGGIDGMSCVVTLVPDEHVGVAVLANLEDVVLPDGLAFWIIDRFLGGPPRDWSSRFLALARRTKAREEASRRRLASGRIRGTAVGRPWDACVGRYTDAYYGDVVVHRRGRRLLLRFGRWYRGPLIPSHGGTFTFRPTGSVVDPPIVVSFAVGGARRAASIRLHAGTETPRFVRVR